MRSATTTRPFCARSRASMPNSRNAVDGARVAPFFRMGSWIGGDRDGNPNVGAETLKEAFRQQCEIALRHYLVEVHELGAELSMSQRLVGCTPELRRAREPVGRRQPASRRYALSACLDRRLRPLGGDFAKADRHGRGPAGGDAGRAVRDADELQADLAMIEASLRAHHGEALVCRGSRRCAARSRCSAFILRRSICGRTPNGTRKRR